MDQTYPAMNYSLHTTLFTLADRRHVHPESLIPTGCEREIECWSETAVSRRYFTCLSKWTCRARFIHLVVVRRRRRRRRRHRKIGGTRANADSAIATPNRDVSHGVVPIRQ